MAPLKSEHSATALHPDGGFSPDTKIFRSLRPPVSFPPSATPCSLPDYLFTLLRHHRHRHHSLIDAVNGRRIPISDLPGLVRALASNLRRRFHLSKGDVVFVLSPNSIYIPVLYLAVLSLGAVVCPSNPLSSASEISTQIHISNPTVAFAAAESASRLPALRGGTVVLDSPDFESLLPQPHDETVRVNVSQNDTAAILFSSGTTGRVKGVELTHRNLIFSIAGVWATRSVRPSPAVTLCAVPFFHVYGFMVCVRNVALGRSVVVSRMSLESILGAVEEFGVTHLAVAPPTVVAIVKSAAAEKYDLRSLEAVECGGAPLANSVITRFNQRFPNVSIVQAYGLTETTGGITRTLGPNESKVIGSNGRLASDCEAKIVDPLTGHSLPPLSPGELWIRGPTVMKGYVGDKEATAAIIDSDGWLRTGDICYFDDQGFMFCVDRMKELIKYKGYQVAPAELEDLLLSHPAIADAAVIPFPDESAGQIPVAFVVRKPRSKVNDSEIMDFVGQQVAPYKKIRRVFFIDSIPKNAPGKILRKELAELAFASVVTSKL